jgi:hypothetical protein
MNHPNLVKLVAVEIDHANKQAFILQEVCSGQIIDQPNAYARPIIPTVLPRWGTIQRAGDLPRTAYEVYAIG